MAVGSILCGAACGSSSQPGSTGGSTGSGTGAGGSLAGNSLEWCTMLASCCEDWTATSDTTDEQDCMTHLAQWEQMSAGVAGQGCREDYQGYTGSHLCNP